MMKIREAIMIIENTITVINNLTIKKTENNKEEGIIR